MIYWSFFLMVWGILGLYLASNGHKEGWAVNIPLQGAWVVYALVSGQYGFIFSAVAYAYVYWKGYKNMKAIQQALNRKWK